MPNLTAKDAILCVVYSIETTHIYDRSPAGHNGFTFFLSLLAGTVQSVQEEHQWGGCSVRFGKAGPARMNVHVGVGIRRVIRPQYI